MNSEYRELIKTRLRARGQITLPNEVREALNLVEGDDLVFSIEESGRVSVARATFIDPEQAWFWSQRWQNQERQAQADIDAGRVSRYADMEEAISDLERTADAGDRDC